MPTTLEEKAEGTSTGFSLEPMPLGAKMGSLHCRKCLSVATLRDAGFGGVNIPYLLNTVPSSSSFLLPTWQTTPRQQSKKRRVNRRTWPQEEVLYLLVHIRRNQVVAHGQVAREDGRGGAARNLADGEHRDLS